MIFQHIRKSWITNGNVLFIVTLKISDTPILRMLEYVANMNINTYWVEIVYFYLWAYDRYGFIKGYN